MRVGVSNEAEVAEIIEAADVGDVAGIQFIGADGLDVFGQIRVLSVTVVGVS
jgi:hypothetical protein